MQHQIKLFLSVCFFFQSFLGGCKRRGAEKDLPEEFQKEVIQRQRSLRNAGAYKAEEIKKRTEEFEARFAENQIEVLDVSENLDEEIPQIASLLAQSAANFFGQDYDAEVGAIYLGENLVRFGLAPHDERSIGYARRADKDIDPELAKEIDNDMRPLPPEYIFHLHQNMRQALDTVIRQKKQDNSDVIFMGCSPEDTLWQKNEQNGLFDLNVVDRPSPRVASKCGDFILEADPNAMLMMSFFVWIHPQTKEQFQGVAVRRRGLSRGMLHQNAVFVNKSPVRAHVYPMTFKIQGGGYDFDYEQGYYPVEVGFFPNVVPGTSRFAPNLVGLIQEFFGLQLQPRTLHELSQAFWMKFDRDRLMGRLGYTLLAALETGNLFQIRSGLKGVRMAFSHATHVGGRGRSVLSTWWPVIKHSWNIVVGAIGITRSIYQRVLQEQIMNMPDSPFRRTLLNTMSVTYNFILAIDDFDSFLFIGSLFVPSRRFAWLSMVVNFEYRSMARLQEIEKRLRRSGLSPADIKVWRKGMNELIHTKKFAEILEEGRKVAHRTAFERPPQPNFLKAVGDWTKNFGLGGRHVAAYTKEVGDLTGKGVAGATVEFFQNSPNEHYRRLSNFVNQAVEGAF
jgi:hypothetical protein